MTEQLTTVRFVVRDDIGTELWERRSADLAKKCGKAEGRTKPGRIVVVRVETFKNVTRERRVASY